MASAALKRSKMTDLEKFEFICSHFENSSETCKILVLESDSSVPIHRQFFVSPKFAHFQFSTQAFRRKIWHGYKVIDFYHKIIPDSLRGLRYDSGFIPDSSTVGGRANCELLHQGLFI